MTDNLTFTEYQDLVEKQGRAMLDAMAHVATGTLDIDFEIPEGIEVLSELGIAFSFLLEDFRNLVDELQQTQLELEDRVKERTQELQEAFTQSQVLQRRYIHNEWTEYTNQSDKLQAPPAMQTTMIEALEGQKLAVDQAEDGDANLAIPVTFSDEVIGVLGFGQGTSDTWTDQDLEDVEAIVEQVGIALENQRLNVQTHTALTEMRTLNEMTVAISAATNLNGIVNAIADSGVAPNVDLVSLSVIDVDAFDEPHGTTYVAEWRGTDIETMPSMKLGTRLPLNRESAPWIANPDQVVLIGDTHNDDQISDPEREFYRLSNIQATAIIPLFVRQHWLGMLSLNWLRVQNFTEQDTRRYGSLARQLALTLDNQQLLENAQQSLSRLETQYFVSQRMNQAVDTQELVTLIAEVEGLPSIQQIILFDIAWESPEAVKELVVNASWRSSRASSGLPVGRRYNAFGRLGSVISERPDSERPDTDAPELDRHVRIVVTDPAGKISDRQV
ncbi:MAG: GAF domain-containing protein [Chloroflexota bacterium]